MEKSQVKDVIELCGLPEMEVSDFLTRAFLQRGQRLEAASLDDLRELLADLLQDMILQTHEH